MNLSDNERTMISIFGHLEEARDELREAMDSLGGVVSSEIERHLEMVSTDMENASLLVTLHFGGIDKLAKIRFDLEKEENK